MEKKIPLEYLLYLDDIQQQMEHTEDRMGKAWYEGRLYGAIEALYRMEVITYDKFKELCHEYDL